MTNAGPRFMPGGTQSAVDATDPDCGDFYYDPEPINQPMTVSLTGPTRIPVGTTARFVARAKEPDSHVSENCSFLEFGDGDFHHNTYSGLGRVILTLVVE